MTSSLLAMILARSSVTSKQGLGLFPSGGLHEVIKGVVQRDRARVLLSHALLSYLNRPGHLNLYIAI